ncbi:hypothetical protein BX600DRAFT_215305 [Xylariales sp. PMI_506]|nr:hypothetical protein BX600DRAFT_215305 [Xylariales sp. PMI_506]
MSQQPANACRLLESLLIIDILPAYDEGDQIVYRNYFYYQLTTYLNGLSVEIAEANSAATFFVLILLNLFASLLSPMPLRHCFGLTRLPEDYNPKKGLLVPLHDNVCVVISQNAKEEGICSALAICASLVLKSAPHATQMCLISWLAGRMDPSMTPKTLGTSQDPEISASRTP